MTEVAGVPGGGDDRPLDADSALPTPGVWTTATQSDLEDLLHVYAEHRRQRARAEAEMDAISRMVKPWLEVNDQDLYDEERGWHAYLQPRRGPKPYDLLAIWNKDRALFERLLMTGCLTVNAKALQAQRAQVAGAEKYAGPEPVTYSLQVERTIAA